MAGHFVRDSQLPCTLPYCIEGRLTTISSDKDHAVNHPLGLDPPLLFFTRRKHGYDTERFGDLDVLLFLNSGANNLDP